MNKEPCIIGRASCLPAINFLINLHPLKLETDGRSVELAIEAHYFLIFLVGNDCCGRIRMAANLKAEPKFELPSVVKSRARVASVFVFSARLLKVPRLIWK